MYIHIYLIYKYIFLSKSNNYQPKHTFLPLTSLSSRLYLLSSLRTQTCTPKALCCLSPPQNCNFFCTAYSIAHNTRLAHTSAIQCNLPYLLSIQFALLFTSLCIRHRYICRRVDILTQPPFHFARICFKFGFSRNFFDLFNVCFALQRLKNSFYQPKTLSVPKTLSTLSGLIYSQTVYPLAHSFNSVRVRCLRRTKLKSFVCLVG